MRNAFNAARATALWTFLGTLSLTSLEWLQGVAEWASTSGRTPLPGLSILGYGAVSAAAAAGAGLLNFLFRAAQAKDFIPGQPPIYERELDHP